MDNNIEKFDQEASKRSVWCRRSLPLTEDGRRFFISDGGGSKL